MYTVYSFLLVIIWIYIAYQDIFENTVINDIRAHMLLAYRDNDFINRMPADVIEAFLALIKLYFSGYGMLLYIAVIITSLASLYGWMSEDSTTQALLFGITLVMSVRLAVYYHIAARVQYALLKAQKEQGVETT